MTVRIYTLTPNPALDLSGHVDRIRPNEKNYVSRARVDPGGNGINSGRMVRRLGQSAVLLGFSGGAAGKQLVSLILGEGLRPAFTRIRGDTRTNVTVTDQSRHCQTRLTFPGPEIRRDEMKALLRSVERIRAPAILVLSGSPPQGRVKHFYSETVNMATSRGLGVVVDVPTGELKKLLSGSAAPLLMIKPNEAELVDLVGKPLRSRAKVMDEARRLLDRVAIVCVSLGKDGAVLLTRSSEWAARNPRVRVRGCVGAGDSMVGAMVSALARHRISTPQNCASASPEVFAEALRWGVAAGAATAASEGTSLGSASLVRKLVPKVRVEKVE